MLKFHFNLYKKSLKLISAEQYFYEVPETSKFTYFNGVGFHFGEGWIIFSVQAEKVKVIYKTNYGTYYRREVSRPPGGVVEVEFSEWDKV